MNGGRSFRIVEWAGVGARLVQRLAAFGHISALDLSGLARITSLLVLPFVHEDLAIVLGGYIVGNNLLPVGLVAVSIYSGMVASDFALYGIGAASRHPPRMSRFAVDDRMQLEDYIARFAAAAILIL